MSPALLGLRLVRGNGRSGWARLGLIVGGTGLGVACLLQILTLGEVLGDRRARASDRYPTVSDPDAVSAWFRPIDLRAGGRLIRGFEVAFDDTVGGPTPPGAPRLPAPGESFVSPALAVELDRSQTVAAIFDGRVAGILDDQGLVSPDELFAWVGTSRGDLPGGGRPFDSFGIPWDPEPDVSSEQSTMVTLMLVGLVGTPLVVYLVVCARLSAEVRDRRLAALRLIGMTRAETGRASAVESAVGGAGGAVLGIAIHLVVAPLLARAGFGGLVWFDQDGRLTAGTFLLVVVAIVCASSLTGRLGATAAINHALIVRRTGAARRSSWLRIVPVGVGCGILLGFLIADAMLGEDRSVAHSADYVRIGLLLTAVGLPLGLPVAVAAIAAAIARRAKRLGTLLATRRLEVDPGSPVRVVAGLVTVLFLMGVAIGLLRAADLQARPLGDTDHISLTASDFGAAERAHLQELDMVDATGISLVTSPEVLPPGAAPGPEHLPIGVIFADCASLELFVEESATGCDEERPYRLRIAQLAGAQPNLRPGTVLSLPLDRTRSPELAEIEVPEEVMQLATGGVLAVDVRYPLSMLPKHEIPETAEVFIGASAAAETQDALTAQLVELSRSAELYYINDDLPTRIHISVFTALIRSAMFLGLAVAFMAFVVAAIDRASTRRAEVAALAVTGVPRSTIRLAQALQSGLALALGVPAALVLGKLAEQATLLNAYGNQDWSLEGAAATLLLLFMLAIASIGGSVLAIPKPVDAALIRRD